MSASNRFNELDNLMQHDLMTGLYVYPVSFDFALLSLTVFTTLCSSMRERICNPLS